MSKLQPTGARASCIASQTFGTWSLAATSGAGINVGDRIRLGPRIDAAPREGSARIATIEPLGKDFGDGEMVSIRMEGTLLGMIPTAADGDFIFVETERIEDSGGATHAPLDFAECATCALKPGAPYLCKGCQWNRRAINRLKRDLAELKSKPLPPVPKPDHHATLVAYLLCAVQRKDWHAVRDAAVDIEILEAKR